MKRKSILVLILSLTFFYSYSQNNIYISTIVKNVTCFSGSNGSITVSVTGGSGNYDYRLAEGSAAGWGTSNIFSSLSAGTYPVSVRDRYNTINIKTIYVDIAQPQQFLVSGTATPTTCIGSTDGKIALSVSGGTAPYTYTWTQNNIAISSTSKDLTNLAPGVYNATVTDANGCQQQITSNSAEVITPLKMTGYNIDGIANGTNTASSSSASNTTVTNPLDKAAGGYNGANFYVNGYKSGTRASALNSNGLPISRSFTSTLNSAHPFAFEDYSSNNTLHLDGNGAYGILKLNDANMSAYQNLYVLATSCNGTSNVSYNVVYTDSTKTNTITTTITDWNGGTANVALGNLKRLNYTGSSVGQEDGSGAIFNIYEFTIPLNLNNKKVAYIRFENGSVSQANIFGITGQTYSSTGIVIASGSTESKTPTISITNSQQNNTFCIGENIVLSSNVENVGSNPTYQWYLGTNAINGATENSYTPILNTTTTRNYRVVVTADASVGCVTSNTASNLIVLTNGSVNTSVSITSTNTNICEGASALFTAAPINGGDTPNYEWYVNGNIVNGNSGNKFTTSNLKNGNNAIYAILKSSINCAIPNMIQSNTISLVQNPTVQPQISIFGSETPSGSKHFAYYIQDSTNLGKNPIYQWMNNDNTISGANAANYNVNNPTLSDLYSLSVKSSMACASPVMVMSNYVSPTIILPITLNRFVISLNNNVASVSWKTDMESNVSHFNIWRSYNNAAYSIVAVEKAKNSALGANYNVLDTLRNGGIYYYYLENVDFDGQKQKSDVSSINYTISNMNSKVYPNPFTSQIQLEFNTINSTLASILVYNLNGAIVSQRNINVLNGYNKFSIENLSNLISGMYILKVIDTKNHQTILESKIIKK